MSSLSQVVRIYIEDDNGIYFDDKETIDFSDFGGTVPIIGDRIISGLSSGQSTR